MRNQDPDLAHPNPLRLRLAGDGVFAQGEDAVFLDDLLQGGAAAMRDDPCIGQRRIQLIGDFLVVEAGHVVENAAVSTPAPDLRLIDVRYAGTRPATRRTFRGPASHMARIDSAQIAVAITKAWS